MISNKILKFYINISKDLLDNISLLEDNANLRMVTH